MFGRKLREFWGSSTLDEPVVLEGIGPLHDEMAKRDPEAEEAERRKQRDETRRKLGTGDPPVYEPDKPCPKCGSSLRKLTLRRSFTYPEWYLRVEVGCSISVGCPEGEHIDVECLTCSHRWAALCLDAQREESA